MLFPSKNGAAGDLRPARTPKLAAVFLLLPAVCWAQTKPDPDKGNEVFDEQCAQCHSAYTSEKKAGPSLQFLFLKSNSEAAVLRKIDKGGGKMPAFKDTLTPQDKADLLAYLKTL